MKKINRLATLMCLLFALGACGGSDEIKYADDEGEEEGENSGYVGPNGKTNTPDPEPEPEPEPQINPIFETDSGKAFIKLCSLANEQLITAKNLTANKEYVTGIVSLEYANDKVVFSAKGDKQDNMDYFVKVTMSYSFASADDFITKMVDLDVKNASTYSVSCDVKNINGEPQVNNSFHELKSTKFSKFDESKPNSQCCYKVDGNDKTYFAFTYVDTDSKIHSINELEFDVTNRDVAVTSEYELASSTSEKMYKFFDVILENY